MKLIYIGVLLLSTLMAHGQQDSSQAINDSIQQQLNIYQQQIKSIAQKNIQDSLRKAELMTQIETLKERDKYKQAELLRQIRDIELKDSVRKAERREKLLAMKANTVGFPVAPFGDTLLYYHLKQGSLYARERATNTSNKIIDLYENDFFSTDSLKVVNTETTSDILYDDMIVMSINDLDALWEGIGREKLAVAYADLIRTAIVNERERNSFVNIAKRLGLTVLIILITWLLVFVLNRLFRKAHMWLTNTQDNYFRGVKIRDYEILPPDRQVFWAHRLLIFTKWLIFALIVYLSLPLIFSIFPFTKGWAHTLFSWIWNPVKQILAAIWGYLPNLFSILVIYLVTRYTVRFLSFLAKEVENGRLKVTGFHQDWASPTMNIVKFLLYAFMFVVIFPYLPGSDSPIFQGVSVFLGILFSLGSSTAIANAVSGLVITYMRPFQIGDRVKIGEITGMVVEKSLLVTRIRTIKNEHITVPNASILTGHTINYSSAKADDGIILHTTVTIGYDVPWRDVHQLLISAAEATGSILTDKKPFVLQTSLDDYYVSYQLNAYTKEPERMAAIYSELHQHIQDKFNEGGVEILSPHYRALRDGNMVTIPADYLPKDYQAPSFNVNTTK